MNRLGVGNFRLSGSKWLAVEGVFQFFHTTLFGELLSYYYVLPVARVHLAVGAEAFVTKSTRSKPAVICRVTGGIDCPSTL